MTVHGAKGLQAPIVILPEVGGGRGEKEISWRSSTAPAAVVGAAQPKEYRAPAWKACLRRDEAARLEEENRLLYVALTRAEDRLLVCGWGKEPKGWYTLIEAGFRRLEGMRRDPVRAGRLRRARRPATSASAPCLAHRLRAGRRADGGTRGGAGRGGRPAARLGRAPRPARGGRAASPPPPCRGEDRDPGRRRRMALPTRAAGASAAAGWSTRLLQHLPDRPDAEREAAARRFLARPGHGLSEAEQAETAAEVLALLAAPEAARGLRAGQPRRGADRRARRRASWSPARWTGWW